MSVRYERDGAVAVVTIDRPERRNAVDPATAALLVAAFERFADEGDASVAILTGAGGTFCAGYDLQAVASGGTLDVLHEQGPAPMGPSRMVLPKPVLAAVEGYAVAGGLELALWCDLRVAAGDAVFGVFSRRFGVPLVDLGTIRLPRAIGQSHALDMILTGRPVGAVEAKGMGLVNRLAPHGEALAVALELAKQIAAFPQRGLRNDRLAVLEQWGLTTADAIRAELERGRDTIASGETSGGAARFSSGEGRHGGF